MPSDACRTGTLFCHWYPYTFRRGLVHSAHQGKKRLLTLHEWPRAGLCQWTKRPGAVLLPGRLYALCLYLYLGCREGDVGAFWLVILLGQVVGASDSLGPPSLGGGYMSVAAGFVLLHTAVGVDMGRCFMA